MAPREEPHAGTAPRDPKVDDLVALGRAALPWLADAGRRGRARLLDAIASRLEEHRGEIVRLGDEESALGEARMDAELTRTCYQLRFLGHVAEEGSYLDLSVEDAGTVALMPDVELRRINVPLGVVGVFEASNFPLAFGAVGGDTASALAAGCPVVLKAHSAHARLTDLIGRFVGDTLADHGAPPGVFQVVHGREAGMALVQHPDVTAVGFTGSEKVGRVLLEAATRRPSPIPFYGELGSVNPLVVTRRAAAERSADIGEGTAQSMLLGNGQFCTKPGLFLVPAGADGDELVDTFARVVEATPRRRMLTSAIADEFLTGVAPIFQDASTSHAHPVAGAGDAVTPGFVEVSVDELFAGSDALLSEHFGPFGVICRYRDLAEAFAVVSALRPSLTAAVHAGSDDDSDARVLVESLSAKAGRVILDGYPTGVAVAWSMMHGGPYPATSSTTTSVGADAIRRWVRPVCYQNVAEEFLPEELRTDALSSLPHRRNGRLFTPVAGPPGDMP